MRVLLILILTVCSFYTYLQGQSDTSKLISLDDLKMPSAPGFVLLDVAPSSILKPSGPKRMAVSLTSAIVGDYGIPKNFAMEIAPYWFTKHEKMTAKKYHGIGEGDTINLTHLISNMSISLASISKNSIDSLSGVGLHNFSLGVRTRLVSIKSPKVGKVMKEMASVLHSLEKEYNIILDVDVEKDSDEEITRKTKEYGKGLLEYLTKNKKYIEAMEDVEKFVSIKPIFVLDFAMAEVLSFDGVNSSSLRHGRFGAWLTAALSLPISEDEKKEKDYFSLLASFRYMNGNVIDTIATNDTYNTFVPEHFFDVGGRAELQFQRFAFWVEALYRRSFVGSVFNTYRVSGSLQFKIQDGVYVTGTFGRNFGEQNNLISFLGINWGIGQEKIKLN